MKPLCPLMPWEEKEDVTSTRAAEFLGQRRFGSWTEADQAALDKWLAESTSHYVAYLRLKGIAARAEGLAAQNALESARTPNGAPRKFRSSWFAIPLVMAAAASIALIAAPRLPLLKAFMQPPDRTYSTDVGGRTLVKFGDGTEVELNTDTVMRFRMTTTERKVWLQRGEAWFHVAHNAQRPFAVVIGGRQITDLGTEFYVRRKVQGLEVALLNGRAALSGDGALTTVLKPGDDAIATSTFVSVTHKTSQELNDELAWRRGMLVFRGARLSDAVREVNRYNTVKLVIVDPSIANLRFTGEVRNDNFEDFLETAQTLMGLHADRRGGDILLSRATPQRTQKAARTNRQQ